MQRAGKLVPVHQAQLAYPQGQVPVGVGLALVDHHTARAVHGLDGKIFLVDNGGVHVVFIVVPVAGALPQLPAEDDRCGDLHIAVLLVNFPPVVDEQVLQHHALGQEEGETGAFVPKHEQVQLLAQLAVVTLFGLFQHLQVLVQQALFGEGNAVHPGEHLVFGVTPPVGAGDGGELHRLHATGAQQMGAGAQVGEIPLLVKADVLPFSGVLGDQLLLVGLVCHELLGFFRGQLKALQGQVFLDDLLHLRLNGRQVLGGEGLLHVEVVVEPVFNGRANGKLGAGVQPHHCLGHDVGGGVPVGVLALRRIEGEDFQGAVLFQGRAQVANLPVHFGGAGGFVQPHANGLGHIRRGDTCFKFLALAFQIDRNHRLLLSAGTNKKPAPAKLWGRRSASFQILPKTRGSTRIQSANPAACSPRCASSLGPVTGPSVVP